MLPQLSIVRYDSVVPAVRKAVFPAAGLGTRFLPATKAIPKEMLPVVDRPAIQYVVEEAVQAGLTDILIITGRGKRAVEDHFDRNFELEHYLDNAGKHDLLKQVQFASDLADLHYVRQRDPLGLGHAVSVARHHVGDEPFAVLLADDLMIDDGALLRAMLDVHEREQRSCIAFTEVTPDEISSYGCIDPDPGRTDLPDDVVEIRRVVEKPPRDEAPSNFAISGRYVFTPEIFAMLDLIDPGRGGELQLTDAIASLLAEMPVYAYEFEGTRYDCGDKLGYLEATVAYGLKHPEVGEGFAAYLRGLK
jgi:UTP--glucose-1-phosphate uridylyltransferase